jgi:hypothetical protein
MGTNIWVWTGGVFCFVLFNVTVNCDCIVSAGREMCPSAILSTTNCCHYCHARTFPPKHSHLYQTRWFTSKRKVNFMVTATKPPTWHWKYEFCLDCNFKIYAVILLQQMWPYMAVLHNAQAMCNKENKLISKWRNLKEITVLVSIFCWIASFVIWNDSHL